MNKHNLPVKVHSLQCELNAITWWLRCVTWPTWHGCYIIDDIMSWRNDAMIHPTVIASSHFLSSLSPPPPSWPLLPHPPLNCIGIWKYSMNGKTKYRFPCRCVDLRTSLWLAGFHPTSRLQIIFLTYKLPSRPFLTQLKHSSNIRTVNFHRYQLQPLIPPPPPCLSASHHLPPDVNQLVINQLNEDGQGNNATVKCQVCDSFKTKK